MEWKTEDLLKHPSNTLHITTFSAVIEEYRTYFPILLRTTFDSYIFYCLYSALSCFLYTMHAKCNLKAFLTILNYHMQIKIEGANGSTFYPQ